MPKDSPWLDVLEYAAERTRRDLGVATLSISSFESRARRLRTLVNTGVLGPGEEPRPAQELYSLDRYPLVQRLCCRRTPYLSSPTAPGGAAELALESALEKSSQAAAPIIVDDRVWGELWTASTLTDEPLTEDDLPGICSAAERFGAGLARALADLRGPRRRHAPLHARPRGPAARRP
jgi:GAF domain-containing protein